MSFIQILLKVTKNYLKRIIICLRKVIKIIKKNLKIKHLSNAFKKKFLNKKIVINFNK